MTSTSSSEIHFAISIDNSGPSALDLQMKQSVGFAEELTQQVRRGPALLDTVAAVADVANTRAAQIIQTASVLPWLESVQRYF